MSVASRAEAALIPTYSRPPVTFVRGDGSWVYDSEGNDYLDCLGGIAVVAIGHANQRVARAVSEQMATLVHTSNLYYTEPQVLLAERLTALSGLDAVFFANCGATANEAAIKLARRYGQLHHGPNCHEIVSLDSSFHGRTLATLAATGNAAKQATFQPLPAGFHQVAPGDLGQLAEVVSERTAAVMVETMQGEGGVVPLDGEYLQAVRQLCDDTDTLMIIDDVQAGMGRTGAWFSWHTLGFEPDIATSAKALANGLPIGACLARAEVASAFQPGDHATTFGGGPVVCAAALATIEEIIELDLLTNCRDRSEQLSTGLAEAAGVSSVRGRGLLLGAVLDESFAPEVAEAALDVGLLVNAVQPDVVRFAPPLSLSEDEAAEALNRFGKALADGRS